MTINDVCLQGDPQRGKDIIKFFEVMGVKNRINVGAERDCYYYYASETGDQGSWIGAIEQTKKTLIRLQPNSLLPESWCVRTPCKSVLNWINNNLEPHEDGQREYYLDGDGWFGSLDGCRWCDNHAWAIDLTESQFLALSGYKPEQKELIDMVKEMCKKEDSDDWDRLKQAPAQKERREEPFQWTDELVMEYADSYLVAASDITIEMFKDKKSRKALFTTEDGVPVYEGDHHYYVFPDAMIVQPCEAKPGIYHPNLKRFSTKEAAEKYIFNHKPVLSYHDINLIFAEVTDAPIAWTNLQDLIHSRLK